jgi:4-amino-4-deoxy-L-arabinose transferase-like glycosyltransferase
MAVRTEGIAATDRERYWRYTLHAVLLVTAARLVWLALGKADLYPDEAQYWWWGQHLAFGYYSKPPVVAWLIRLTTSIFGEDELAVRLAAPLLHFAAALAVFGLARRLYDARVAAWSAVIYATLPGVSASALIISTDAPLLLCWILALLSFVRAREEGGRWWLAVGVAAGFGLLSKYAMAYWLISAFLFLAVLRDERRHLKPFLGAVVLALAIYAPNFAWNAFHGFVSYHHTEANAAFHGLAFHGGKLLTFLGSQFGVFGPLLFAALIAIVAQGPRALAERRALLLAFFALPTLAMMLVVSALSRAEPNWAAPTYVSATVLVVAWLLAQGWRSVAIASLALHVTAAAVMLELPDIAHAAHWQLPARFDILHRLRGYRRLGLDVSSALDRAPGAVLLANDRETMAELLYYVRPHPADWMKWNGGDQKVHDQFDIVARPERFIGRDFVFVSDSTDVNPTIAHFASVTQVTRVTIPIGGGEARHYLIINLTGFKGY